MTRAAESGLAGPERTPPTPDEIVKALLAVNDGVRERGHNQASGWAAMRELHGTIRTLYRVPEMPDLAAVISELECIDSRLIELVEKAS